MAVTYILNGIKKRVKHHKTIFKKLSPNYYKNGQTTKTNIQEMLLSLGPGSETLLSLLITIFLHGVLKKFRVMTGAPGPRPNRQELPTSE